MSQSSSNDGIIERSNLDTVISFVDAEPTGAAIKACEFTQAERIAMLVNIMRTGSDKEKLKAERSFDAIIHKTLEVNGVTARLQQSKELTDASGAKNLQTINVTRLARSLGAPIPAGTTGTIRDPEQLTARDRELEAIDTHLASVGDAAPLEEVPLPGRGPEVLRASQAGDPLDLPQGGRSDLRQEQGSDPAGHPLPPEGLQLQGPDGDGEPAPGGTLPDDPESPWTS